MASLLTRLALRHPLATIAFLAFATVLAALGATRLRSADLIEGHLPPGDPELAVLNRLVEEFGGDKVMILALGCGGGNPCEEIFELPVLELVRDLSEAALRFRGVEEVLSLATAGALVADGPVLRVERLAEELDPESIGRFRAAVVDEPMLLGSLVSRDLRTTAVIVRFDPSLPDDLRNRSALDMRDALVGLSRGARFELLATGHVIRTAAADAYVRRDLARLSPAMIAVLAALLVWIFRDATSVALALLTVAVPAVWAFGLMCWTDRPLTPVVSVMPILILVVGVTDAIHFLVRFHDLRASRGSLREVLEEVVREVGPPTTVTACTAALGFLSFMAARLPNLQDFGILAAFGVLGAWFTTFTLLPAVLVRLGSRIRVRVPPAFALGERVLDLVRSLGWRRANAVLAVASVGAIVSLLGIARIVPDNDASKLLGEGDPMVRADRFVRERLRPLDTIELLYELPDGLVVTDPAVLARLEAAEGVLEARVGSGAVVSLLPVLRLAHREIVNGSFQLPEDPRTAAQLLLLAEAADADTVHRLVTPDRRMTRLSAGYAWAGGRDMQDDLAYLRGALETALGESGKWFLTGSISLAVHVGELVLEGQIASFSTAFITIFALVFFFLRSFSLGVLGMVPNVYPVALILAFMGFTGINLDIGTAMIASILLGVSVDDTIYFLLHYQRARRGGASPADAVAYTFAVAGKPALFCAVSLALGFFVLAFSSFQSLAIFGLLSGVAVLLAVGSELLLMPAVIRVATRARKRE